MDLFDDIERTELRTPISADTKHGYLNLSARPPAEAVRAFLENLLVRYPAQHRHGLVSRMRSLDRQHESAVFELLTHELLIRSGCEVVEIEPKLEARPTSPDFLVRAPDDTEFIVECVVASGVSDAEAGREKLLNSALDAVGATPSADHFLSVDVKGVPTQAVDLKALRRRLTAWIAELPAGAAAKATPAFRYEQNGLRLRVKAMLPRNHPPAADDRSVGAVSFGLRAATPGDDLRAALVKKAKKYGDLGKPFVIAVNDSGRSGEQLLMDALLGSPLAVFREQQGGGLDAHAARASDGLWTDGARPRKQGVSAVLWFYGAHSWRPWGRDIRLVRNPWATHTLPGDALPFPALNPVQDQFVRVAGQQGPGLFGLPEDWPPGD